MHVLAKLRQADALLSPGFSFADAALHVDVSEET